MAHRTAATEIEAAMAAKMTCFSVRVNVSEIATTNDLCSKYGYGAKNPLRLRWEPETVDTVLFKGLVALIPAEPEIEAKHGESWLWKNPGP